MAEFEEIRFADTTQRPGSTSSAPSDLIPYQEITAVAFRPLSNPGHSLSALLRSHTEPETDPKTLDNPYRLFTKQAPRILTPSIITTASIKFHQNN